MAGPKQAWGSRVGVILAVAGSAVGLGNFLRFPGQAAAHGGGAFMIPYFVALLLLGIPIGWAEWTMGRHGGLKGAHGAPAIFGVIGGKGGRYLGAIGVLIPLAVYFYYVLIEAWCLQYFFDYVTAGGIGIDVSAPTADQAAASQSYFGAITGAAHDGANFESGFSRTFVFWIITFMLNGWFVYRGLSGGIEKVANYGMPLMAVCALVVLVRVLTLGTPDPSIPEQSVLGGLGFMWNPDFTALADPETWLAAAGQIFFSLSVGFGVIINYASYMKKSDDVVLSGLTASATNEFFEVALGGMITLTASVVFLGVVATSAASGSSFNLGFNTLPVVFAQMPGGAFIGALWFLMLFLAAFTSSLSMLQPAKAFLEESLGVGRGASTLLVLGTGLVGNLFVLYYSGDLVALDAIDTWVGTLGIFILAGIQLVLFGWVWGVDKGFESAHVGAQIRIPAVFRVIIKYVSPTYLLLVFAAFCVQSLPKRIAAMTGADGGAGNPVEVLSLGLVGATLLAILAVIVWGAPQPSNQEGEA